MVLAGPCRLPVHIFVRIILPDIREGVITTRRRKNEKTRKITRYLLLTRPDWAAAARTPDVIPLTLTA
jgi:hypothetical protein